MRVETVGRQRFPLPDRYRCQPTHRYHQALEGLVGFQRLRLTNTIGFINPSYREVDT